MLNLIYLNRIQTLFSYIVADMLGFSYVASFILIPLGYYLFRKIHFASLFFIGCMIVWIGDMIGKITYNQFHSLPSPMHNLPDIFNNILDIELLGLIAIGIVISLIYCSCLYIINKESANLVMSIFSVMNLCNCSFFIGCKYSCCAKLASMLGIMMLLFIGCTTLMTVVEEIREGNKKWAVINCIAFFSLAIPVLALTDVI